MTITVIAVQLKKMVTDDDIKGTIELIQENLVLLEDHISESDLMQYTARLSSIDREKFLGIISEERYSIERNQLRQLLIEKIVQLQKEKKEEKLSEQTVQLNDGDLLLEEATKLYWDGEYRQAESAVKKAMAEGFVKYDQAEAYAILGNIYNQLDYFQDAIDAYQKALELNPRSAGNWTNLGIAYRLTAQYDKAEPCYMKALELDPNYPELYTSLGAFHLTHTMKFKEAIGYLEKAIQLDPGQAIAYANMAIAQASVGNFAEADQYLVKATMKGYKNTKSAKQMIENLKQL